MTDDELLSTRDLHAYLWTQGEIDYKLDSLQLSIHHTVLAAYSSAKQILVLSSRQIGKSYWALVFAIIFLQKNPRSIVRLLAPTKGKAFEIIEDNLIPIIQDCPPGIIKGERSRMRWTFANGSSLRIGALEAQYVDANRSGNAKIVIYEECGFVRADEFNYARRSVLGPQLIRSNGHEIFVTSPSRDPEHPLHNEIMPTCDILGTLFRYTVYDSPSLSPGQILQAIERCGGEGSDDFQREYMANVVRSSTLMVIPKLDQRICFVETECPSNFWHRLCITGDWGGIRDKTVILLHWYEPRNDIYYFIDEMVFEPNTTTPTIAPPIQGWVDDYQCKNVFLDVHGQTRVDLLALLKLDVKLPPKNDWLSGVNTMAAKFAMDKVRVGPKCLFLRKSILGGIFNKSRSDFDRSEVLGHMDGCAAAMYAVRTAHLAEDRHAAPQVTQGMEKVASPFKTFGAHRKEDPDMDKNFIKMLRRS